MNNLLPEFTGSSLRYAGMKGVFHTVNYQLKAWRKSLNLSQQEVADQMGVTRETYSSYEQGRRLPSVYSLFAMEKVLGVASRKIYESFDGAVVTDSCERSIKLGCNKNSQLYFEDV